jgi:hypothetical protein
MTASIRLWWDKDVAMSFIWVQCKIPIAEVQASAREGDVDPLGT